MILGTQLLQRLFMPTEPILAHKSGSLGQSLFGACFGKGLYASDPSLIGPGGWACECISKWATSTMAEAFDLWAASRTLGPKM